jgi:hypothetical protein
MPLTTVEPPESVRSAATSHVYQLAGPHGNFLAFRLARREKLALVAPHRMYTLNLDAVLERGLESATQSGWRFLVTDGEHIVASAEVADDAGSSPLVNSGPYVASTAEAIDALETIPDVKRGIYEFKLLKLPALYVVAAWLHGERDLIVPMAPTPSFLEAGQVFSEQEFVASLTDAARQALDAEGRLGA